MMQSKLRKEITVNASPDVVFRALTDEKELVQWMPKEAKMDARMGGRYEFKYYWAERGLESSASGTIVEYDPGKKLSYTWEAAVGAASGSGHPSDNGDLGQRPPSVVSWILDELPDGRTKVTLVQTGVDTKFSKDAENGWNHFMAQLAHHCNTG